MVIIGRIFRSLFYTGLVALLIACGSDENVFSIPPVAPSVEPVKTALKRLPVSYNDVMVSLINEAADPIWRAGWKTPETDRDWRQLEHRARQLKLAGALLSQPGSGPIDHQWSLRPEWNKWAAQLVVSGDAAIRAIDARNREGVSRAGDTMVAVCEGCHLDFKPDIPTGGKYGDLAPLSVNDRE